MEGEVICEESQVNVVGRIPAQLKDFSDILIDSVDGKEIYLTIDNEKVKGKIGDTMGTSLFFSTDETEQEANLTSCAEKEAVFEHYFNVPKTEFKKPFMPSEALTK